VTSSTYVTTTPANVAQLTLTDPVGGSTVVAMATLSMQNYSSSSSNVGGCSLALNGNSAGFSAGTSDYLAPSALEPLTVIGSGIGRLVAGGPDTVTLYCYGGSSTAGNEGVLSITLIAWLVP
jgi:hypothetical protein